MMNKRGLSDLVTTVLIILLILIAIGILWFFIKPFIFNSSEKLEGAGSCFQTTVEPTKCLYTGGNGDIRHVFLTIQRQGQAGNVSGINMIFTTSSGELRTFKDTQLLKNITIPDKFETRQTIIRIDKTKTPDLIPQTVKIAIIPTAGGNVCPPFSQEIVCSEYTFSGRGTDINGNGYINGDDYDLMTAAWIAYCGQGMEYNPNCDNPLIQPQYDLAGTNYDFPAVFSIVDYNQDSKVNQDDYRDFQANWWAGQ